MDSQHNDRAPSRQQPSESHRPLRSESPSGEPSSNAPGQANLRQNRQELNSVQDNSQPPVSTLAQSNQLNQGQNEPSQPENGLDATHLNAESSIRDEARVAVVIYDMLMRAGPQAEMLSAHLAQAYPVAAALARYYAMYSCHIMPFCEHRPARRRGSLVLRRVSVSSIASFCSFIAFMFALLRLWIIFSLALGAAIASSSDNVLLYQVVDHIVSLAIEKGPKRQLYRWMFTILIERTPLAALSSNGPTAGGIHTMIPNQAVAALLITPFTSGILGLIIGALAGACINSALQVIGGIRLDSHED